MPSRFSDLPAKMRQLRTDERGYPVPWFVAWVDGKPHFPAMDAGKLPLAIAKDRCWVCGNQLGRLKAFVIGPMCIINLTSSEPPSHPECARFSARRCPFLANPRMKRVSEAQHVKRTGAGTLSPAGIMLDRNPGVCAVWLTKRYRTFDDGNGGTLINIGKPERVEWYAEGRTATRAEIVASINSGLPLLAELALAEPDAFDACEELVKRCVLTDRLLPPGPEQIEIIDALRVVRNAVSGSVEGASV